MIACLKNTCTFLRWLIVLTISFTAQSQTFSNTSSQVIGSWDASFTKTITVSGLPTLLSSPSNVLQQVNVSLGSASDASRNLQSYIITLKSPSNTSVTIKNTHGSLTISEYNVKFRDHASLVFPVSYGSFKEPFNIGYYRTDVANAFDVFNGENPNGTWTISISESSVSSGMAFNRVDLLFGPKLIYNDISSSTTNDECSAAQCMETGKIIIGTNNGYANPGPSTDPLIIGACDWNAAKNNSAWFYFKASANTAKFTISGLSNNLQIVAFSNTGTCAAPSYSLVNGGCPRDANNDTYSSPQYTSTAGCTCNMQLNMSSLTIGNIYYVLVDGTGGAISPFYIEMESGAASCSVLPIDLLYFDARPVVLSSDAYQVHCTWGTQSEKNNAYFIVERSVDGTHFIEVGNIQSNQNSQVYSQYHFTDLRPQWGNSFYRLKQVDQDGAYSYSAVKLVSIRKGMNTLSIFPNPVTNDASLTIHSNQVSNARLRIVNPLGQILYNSNLILQKGMNQKKLSLDWMPRGIYSVEIILQNGQQLHGSLLHR
jgi:hypothetical protein